MLTVIAWIVFVFTSLYYISAFFAGFVLGFDPRFSEMHTYQNPWIWIITRLILFAIWVGSGAFLFGWI